MVFNPLSGNTHALDILTGEVLKAIMTGVSTNDEICLQIVSFLEVDNDSRLALTVNEILLSLEEVGLIQPVI